MAAHRELIRELKAAGYHVEMNRRGHYKVSRPNGSYLLTMSSTPRDPHGADMATRKLLRRLGVTLCP